MRNFDINTMTTAMVSQFYEDAVFSDPNTSYKKSQAKRDLERKAVGSPVFSNSSVSSNSTSSAVFRRSSLSTASTNLHSPLTSKLSIGGLSSIMSNSSSSLTSDHRKLDRSLSEPSPGGDKCSKSASPTNGTSAVAVNSSRYKTELCRPYEENGTCKYGDKCQFAHGEHELRNLARHPKYKTELCRTFHTTGFCPYGPRCHFIHNSEECRKSPPSSPVSTGSGSNMVNRPTSLGSTGEPSPPSSLSDSPTCLGSFSFRETEDSSVFPPSPPASAPATSAHNAFSFSHDFASLVSPTNTQAPVFGNASNNKRMLTATTSLDRYNNNRNMLVSLSELSAYDSYIGYQNIRKSSLSDDNSSGSPVIDSLVSNLDNLCMNDNSIEIGRGCGVVGGPIGGLAYPMLTRLACGED